MTRFFTAAEEMNGDSLILTGENAAHARVLRLKAGEQVLVCDGQGRECLCTVVSMDSTQVELRVLKYRESDAEPAIFASVGLIFFRSETGIM